MFLKKVVTYLMAVVLSVSFISCSDDSSTESGGGGGGSSHDALSSVSGGSYTMNLPTGAKIDIAVTLTNNYEIGKYEISTQRFYDMLNSGLEEGNLFIDESDGGVYYADTFPMLIFTGDNDLGFYDEPTGITCTGASGNSLGSFTLDSDFASLPITKVSYNGAAWFCNMLSKKEGLTELYTINNSYPRWDCDTYGETGYRLPTLAEWQFAAIGGNSSQGYMYSGSNNAEDVAWLWTAGANPGHVQEIGTKNSNELGIYDMSGNASEWTSTYWGYIPDELEYIDPISFNSIDYSKAFILGSSVYDTANSDTTLFLARSDDVLECENYNGFRIVKFTK